MVFDQFKKIAELKKLQGDLKKETVTVEKQGVSVTMNGNFEVLEVKLNKDMGAEEQQGIVKDCLNEAKESLQKKMAQVMMSSGIGF